MGASVALAGASACTKQPKEMIVPYVRQPEEVVPGKPLFYATAMSVDGLATGVLVESHLGRPTKIEGNPAASRQPGRDRRSDAGERPDAVRSGPVADRVTRNGDINSWGNFLTALTGAREVAGLKKGAGFRILTGTVTSPTLASQIQEFLAAYPRGEVAPV